MCERKYGYAPHVEFLGEKNLSFSYIPSHLYYILFEVIKNSLRATVEHHGSESHCPPVKVVIGDGEQSEDVVIKVSDEGGGISKPNMHRVFSYLFTTVRDSGKSEKLMDQAQNPLAGLGYGLPLARCHARYFHGDLELRTIAGYGTDAYVTLQRLSSEISDLV